MKHKFVDPEETAKKLALVQKQLAVESVYHKMIEEVEDYAILLLDTKGVVLNWNKGAEKIKGYKPEEIVGKSFRIFYTEEDRLIKLPDHLLKKARTEGHALQEGWRVRKDGSRFWGSISITGIIEKGHKVIGFTKVTRDLTEKKRNESLIRQAIVDAQEKERNEIAMLLHDGVAQTLVAGKIFAEQALKKNDCDLLKFGIKNIQTALDEIRGISHVLNPTAELNLGLTNAIHIMVDNLNLLEKTKFRFSQSGTAFDLKPEIERVIFRILQELANNILKHSKATKAAVKLLWRKKEIIAVVSDNGTGFDLSRAKKGLGLQSTNFRAEMYDGTVIIKASPGKGTTIRVSFPVA
jgi:PAS domain S-box-containing protein